MSVITSIMEVGGHLFALVFVLSVRALISMKFLERLVQGRINDRMCIWRNLDQDLGIFLFFACL